jgi:hypothetical protein
MIFIGMDFRMLVESCKIKPAFRQSTDHLSVFLKLRSGVQEKDSGFWNHLVLLLYHYSRFLSYLLTF